jgi:hypothetical protein
MNENNQFYSLYNRLIDKYELEDEDALDLIDVAKNIYMGLRNDRTITKFLDHEIFWIRRACYEIIERHKAGLISGVQNYSENGYSWSSNGSLISDNLAGEVKAKVGVISYDN